MSAFLERLDAALAGHSRHRKALIGVSGGRDSMTLLAAMVDLGFDKLIVCHFHHGLRGDEADADARLVERAAGKHALSFDLGAADVGAHARTERLSIETAARELRFAFFRACASAHRCTGVYIGHHADDQVETCLLNFLRGTGAAGLAGMRPAAKLAGLTVFRPMLGIGRAEISSFAAAQGIRFADDSTNEQLTHTRNRLRASVLPAIEAAWGPSYRQAILRAAEILREEDAFMDSLVPTPADELSTKDLRAMPPALRRRLVLKWLRNQQVPEPGFPETERVLALLNSSARRPAKDNLPGGIHVRRRSGKIFLERPAQSFRQRGSGRPAAE